MDCSLLEMRLPRKIAPRPAGPSQGERTILCCSTGGAARDEHIQAGLNRYLQETAASLVSVHKATRFSALVSHIS